MAKNKTTFYILILLTCLITAISFRSYFKYASYNLDDYHTFEFAPAGSSVLERCKATTDFLYLKQARFQPVRLCVFVAMTQLFDEDSSVYYNFALHLINILLLFLFLRKFGVGNVFSIISVLLFAVFGKFRHMDSSSVMIGGSGLNLFFILTALLFLIKSLESHGSEPVRRYLFLALSLLAYSSLVFSYEVAVPLFTLIVVVFYLFNDSGKGLLAPFRTKKLSYLLLYIIPLVIYLVFYRLLVNVDYEGAEIVWSYNIFIRLKSYILYTLIPPIPTHAPSAAMFLVLIIYFAAIILAMKSRRLDTGLSEERSKGLKLLLFGAVFYPSTVVLFILNDWLTPSSVMVHHTYLMTAAGAILSVSLVYNFQWLLPPSIRKKYLAILIILVFPIILINNERHTVRHYKDDASRVMSIRHLKKDVLAAVPDMEKTDAVLLKNFFYPYYDISSMDGALLKWFDFKKDIMSGREIISVRGGDIVFRGPLHRYKKPGELRAKNNRVRILFVRKKDGAVLPYHDLIGFEQQINIYQTKQVYEDCPKGSCADKHKLEAILSNFKRNNYMNIWFTSRDGLERFLKNVTSIEVNDEPVSREKIHVSDEVISIDVSKLRDRINYFFLRITSADDRFKESFRLIALTKSAGQGASKKPLRRDLR